jgi:hypothetical protein
MFSMIRSTLRTLAAVLAGLALVAALPAPCGCAPERTPAGHADQHACCAPPTGVRAAAQGCCDEAPDLAPAIAPSPSVATPAPVAVAVLRAALPSGPAEPSRPSIVPATSPPPAVLRI